MKFFVVGLFPATLLPWKKKEKKAYDAQTLMQGCKYDTRDTSIFFKIRACTDAHDFKIHILKYN